MNWQLRIACMDDVPALEQLIPLSVRVLQSAHYSTAQMEASLGPVFGVDRQLIADGTYFVAEHDGVIVGCGGWSKRRSLFGGDAVRKTEDTLLNPAVDPARVRAFFIHPNWTRRGIGRAINDAGEAAITVADFQRLELVATLTGEPLYLACGPVEAERDEVPRVGELTLPVVRMTKSVLT